MELDLEGEPPATPLDQEIHLVPLCRPPEKGLAAGYGSLEAGNELVDHERFPARPARGNGCQVKPMSGCPEDVHIRSKNSRLQLGDGRPRANRAARPMIAAREILMA